MSIAKNQHWLPQFYLRAFRAPGDEGSVPRIWTFFRNGPEEPRLSSIEEITVKRYLYSPGHNTANRDHRVDFRLQELESMLGLMWPTVANGMPPLDSEAVRKAACQAI